MEQICIFIILALRKIATSYMSSKWNWDKREKREKLRERERERDTKKINKERIWLKYISHHFCNDIRFATQTLLWKAVRSYTCGRQQKKTLMDPKLQSRQGQWMFFCRFVVETVLFDSSSSVKSSYNLYCRWMRLLRYFIDSSNDSFPPFLMK